MEVVVTVAVKFHLFYSNNLKQLVILKNSVSLQRLDSLVWCVVISDCKVVKNLEEIEDFLHIFAVKLKDF